MGDGGGGEKRDKRENACLRGGEDGGKNKRENACLRGEHRPQFRNPNYHTEKNKGQGDLAFLTNGTTQLFLV